MNRSGGDDRVGARRFRGNRLLRLLLILRAEHQEMAAETPGRRKTKNG